MMTLAPLAKLFIGLLIGAGLVALIIFAFPRMRLPFGVDRRAARAALSHVSESIAWAKLEEVGHQAVLVLERRGYRGLVEYRPQQATDVTFDLDGAVDGWLQVTPESVAHGLIRTFGINEIATGDVPFDDEHEVCASDENFARRILSTDVRGTLRLIAARGPYVFRVTPQTMLLRVERPLYDPAALETLVVVATQLFGALGVPERVKVHVQEVREVFSSQSHCEVCGAKLSVGAVVRCAKCRTPHHRDCWEFNRVCSTFACGSREFAEIA